MNPADLKIEMRNMPPTALWVMREDIKMRKTCKQCWGEIPKELMNNHWNFCSKACKGKWITRHEIKGAKKRAKKARDHELMTWETKFDMEGNAYPHG